MGRLCFNKLPLGICSAPEHFQRRMSTILENIPRVLCNISDIIVFGESQLQHDERLNEVLQRLSQAGVTLNNKCEFSKSHIKYLRHIISSEGVTADPEKISAITNVDPPTDVAGVRRIFSKFLPNLANVSNSLRELLQKKSLWR